MYKEFQDLENHRSKTCRESTISMQWSHVVFLGLALFFSLSAVSCKKDPEEGGGPGARIDCITEKDCDGDGVEDDLDAFPFDACASIDEDADGHPDLLIDDCISVNGLELDTCPSFPHENNADHDNDYDPSMPEDLASGGDPCDNDDDNDGIVDKCPGGSLSCSHADTCPRGLVGPPDAENERLSLGDYDGDGCKNAEDNDADNDMVPDYWQNSEGQYISGEGGESVSLENRVQRDQCLFTDLSDMSGDSDQDGCASRETGDYDGDGVVDGNDSCFMGNEGWTSDPSTDADGDGCQDSSEDTDDDNDSIEDELDAFPLDRCLSLDSDSDGYPDHRIEDCSSSMSLALDNCPLVENPDQRNSDESEEIAHGLPLEGNACDSIRARDETPVENRETAEPISVGKKYDRAIAVNYDRDWFSAHLELGQSYEITLRTFSDSRENEPFDPMLRLFYNINEDSFIADNNGDSSAQYFGNAKILYTPTRTGLHWIEVSSGSVYRYRIVYPSNRLRYAGAYILSVKPIASGSFQSHASRLPNRLSQNRDNYELVWEEDYENKTNMDERIWKEKNYSYKSTGIIENIETGASTLGSSTARSLIQSLWVDQLSGHPDIADDSSLQIYNTRAFFRPNDGLLQNNVLRLKIAIPQYSAYPDRFSLVNGVYTIENSVLGRSFQVPDGLLPATGIYDAEAGSGSFSAGGKPTREQEIFGATPGYWGTYLSTESRLETRYGYFEVQVNLKELIETQAYGAKGNFWMDRVLRAYPDIPSEATWEELTALAAYTGYEIDIAENRYALAGGQPKLYSHFRVHGPKHPHAVCGITVTTIRPFLKTRRIGILLEWSGPQTESVCIMSVSSLTAPVRPLWSIVQVVAEILRRMMIFRLAWPLS